MAAYISFQPTDFFTNTLYSGNATSDTAINLGLEPALTWVKAYNDTDGWWQGDVLSGAAYDLRSSNNSAQFNSNYGSAYTSTGFTLTNGTQNQAATNYITYSWKGGTTSGLVAGTHSVNSYSYNATSGFGIYQYTGDNTAGTITHGLGAVPKMIITKTLNSTVDWFVYHVTPGAGKYMVLNDTAAEGSSSIVWGNTTPTSTVFSLGAGAETNTSPNEYIAYVFAEVKGFSKIGSYTGNGNADGSFIYTGFRPAFVLCKDLTNGSAQNWELNDNKRNPYNEAKKTLRPNDNAAEDPTYNTCDLLSNGFKLRSSNDATNKSGYSFMYAAFAAFPFVSSNSKAGTAR